MRRASPTAANRVDTYSDLKNRIQQKLISELDPSMDVSRTAEVRTIIQDMFETMLAEEQIVLSRNEKRNLFEQIVAEILGFGPLEKFLSGRRHHGNHGQWAQAGLSSSRAVS